MTCFVCMNGLQRVVLRVVASRPINTNDQGRAISLFMLAVRFRLIWYSFRPFVASCLPGVWSLSPCISFLGVLCVRLLCVSLSGVAPVPAHDGRRRGAAVDGCPSRATRKPHHRESSCEGCSLPKPHALLFVTRVVVALCCCGRFVFVAVSFLWPLSLLLFTIGRVRHSSLHIDMPALEVWLMLGDVTPRHVSASECTCR